MVEQRPPQLGDWTVCQDKETTKTAIRTNSIDSANQLNVLDWSIADFNGGKETPYLYVPNRVYPMDTVILKPTLEGLMPIPENLDNNCFFETASFQTVILARQPGSYSCSTDCHYIFPPTSCKWFDPYRKMSSPQCPYYGSGVMKALGLGISGAVGVIDFRIMAQSAFEYLDIRITDWPRQYTRISGVSIAEDDALGYVPGQNVGVNFVYQSIGNNVFRIWALPGPGPNNTGNFGPAGTDIKLRVRFTLLGAHVPPNPELVWYGDFPETTRSVEVSYVGAGRRGNHR